MVKKPKVSVVIPFCNRLALLRRAIASVLEQTFRDYEIILIDDGSSENVEDIINLKKNKIRYFRQENQGPGRARNVGIAKSRGRYIAFLDSDDIFMPDKLEKQISLMDQNPAVLLSHTSYLVDDQKTKNSIIHSGHLSGRVFPKIIYQCPIATPTVMVRKKGLGHLRFPESMRIGEDVIFWTEIAQRSEILGLDLPLSKIRKTFKSASANLDLQLQGTIDMMNYHLRYHANNLWLFFELSSLKHLRIYYIYRNKKWLAKSRRELFLAWLFNPFSLTIYGQIYLMVVPETVRRQIRRNIIAPTKKVLKYGQN